MELYDLGLVVGRFQMLHKGHEYIINHALEICKRVVVFVGSSQAYGTEKNPFFFFTREKMLTQVFSTEIAAKKLIIRPLPDIGAGNNDIWGKYVLGAFEAEFHKQPDVYITGCEKERGSWFTDELAPNMDELRISRNNIKTSATEVRQLLLEDKYEEWCKLVPYQLIGDYEYYKSAVIEAKGVK